MRLRLFDRVRRYIRPGPGGSRSRGSTRPGPPAVGGSVVVPPAGRHRRDHIAAPGQESDSSSVSTAMTGGAGTLDGGGPVEPAPQWSCRAGCAGPDRAGPGRTGPGHQARGQPERAPPGRAAWPWPPNAAGSAPPTAGPGTAGRRRTTRRLDPDRPPAAAPPGPGRDPRTGPAPGRDSPGTGTGPGADRDAPAAAAGRICQTGTDRTESPAPGSAWTGTPAPRTSRPAGSGPGSAAAAAGHRGHAGRRRGRTGSRRDPPRPRARPAPACAAGGAKGAAPGKDARGRSGPAADAARGVAGEPARPAEADAARLPWYEVAHARRAAEGYQNCGPLERVLRREWPPSKVPSSPVVRAVNRLAELPLMIKEILAAGVDAIHVGEGGVPELDDMARLRGVPLPSGRATWDACAGAYGERKIIVGSRPSSAPDVMCHEVGHALDDIDREQGRWQSDSAEFRQLYQRCEGSLVSDFHKQPGRSGPPGVLRRRVRRDRLPPAPGAGGHARRQHPDRS